MAASPLSDRPPRQPLVRRPPVSVARQRLVVLAGLALAVGAIVLAARSPGETDPAAPAFSGSAADGGGVRPDDPNAPAAELPITPVEGWFPRSGQGSTCSEPVGVDLIPGYGAIIMINGNILPEEMMNPVGSASRSLGHYTYGPEDDCPNGEFLRPKDNEVQACVYRLEQGPATCQLTEVFTFDAL